MKQYISLMKLRVVELLLVTTVPALFLATNGVPDLSLTFWSLLGGTLAAGGANAFNMVIESDTDKLMKRTANRPIATGQISKTNALLFSSIISISVVSNFLCIHNRASNIINRACNYFLYLWLYHRS
jgi:heme o synthase